MNSPAKNRMLASKFKAIERGRLHPDYKDEDALLVHIECRRLSAETGIKHEVDHIIPLKLGGWHHHKNLQPLPAFLNDQKHSNPFWESVGYKSFKDVPTWLWPEKLYPSYMALVQNSQKDSLTSAQL